MTLLILSTHPVQYHAPVYRELQTSFAIPTTVLYASDFSVAGYHDRDFRTSISWDTDLVSGYDARFLSRVKEGGATSDSKVSAKGIGKQIHQVNPKVILLTGYRLRFDLRAFASARWTRKPLIFRAETIDTRQNQSNPLKKRARDTFLRTFYSQMERLLYIGQNSRNHYLRLGVPETKLVFSPYCVDVATFNASEDVRQQLRRQIRAQLQIDPDRFVILVSGKLIPRKSPDLVLAGVRTLPDSLRSITTLLFLGDGEMAELLLQQAQSFQIDIRLAGFQNQSRLSGYYHAADVMVLASRLETWGVVVNEALHHGIPCVVSKYVGSAPDLVKPDITGYSFDPDNMQQFGDTLQKGYDLSLQPSTRAKCRDLAMQYSVHAAAQGIAAAYHQTK